MEVKRFLDLTSPEPKAKRTVEGDLGVYVNMHNIVDIVGKDKLMENLSISSQELKEIIANRKPIPVTEKEKKIC